VLHGDSYGPRSSIGFQPPELAVRSCSGESLATVTIEDRCGHMAFQICASDDESQWSGPIDAPSEALNAVLGLCCPATEMQGDG
jgi:hypothetical protein